MRWRPSMRHYQGHDAPAATTTPAWILTAVSYASPDARRLTRALHWEQFATYGFADDPADTPPGSSTRRTARSS